MITDKLNKIINNENNVDSRIIVIEMTNKYNVNLLIINIHADKYSQT